MTSVPYVVQVVVTKIAEDVYKVTVFDDKACVSSSLRTLDGARDEASVLIRQLVQPKRRI